MFLINFIIKIEKVCNKLLFLTDLYFDAFLLHRTLGAVRTEVSTCLKFKYFESEAGLKFLLETGQLDPEATKSSMDSRAAGDRRNCIFK